MLKLLRKFLTLGVIIGPLPENILNGEIMDAVPLMANFNWIVAQVNANAGALSVVNSGSIPTFVPPASVSGTANAINLLPTPAITAYAGGQRFSFIPPAGPNTTAVTVSTSGLGVRNLVYADGTAMTGGELVASGVYDIEDNGTNYVLMNSGQASSLASWTPVLAFGGLSVGITYGTQSGQYRKVGKIVYFYFHIVLTSNGSSTGTATIGGLPFASNAAQIGAGLMPSGSVTVQNVTYSTKIPTICVQPGATTMELVVMQSAGVMALLTDTAFAATSVVQASGWYLT